MVDDWMFWLMALAIILGISLFFFKIMSHAHQEKSSQGLLDGSVNHDIAVYKNQLIEVEGEITRGIITKGEAAVLRTEISRRLLAADKTQHTAQIKNTSVTQHLHPIASLFIGFCLLSAIWLYQWLGAPGYSDMPFEVRLAEAKERYENRPNQSEVEAEIPPPMSNHFAEDTEFSELMVRLRQAVTQNPSIEGLTLLARNEAALGNIRAAKDAQTTLVSLKGNRAEAIDYLVLAELLITSVRGYISPQAEAALSEVLKRAPENATARYYLGEMFAQVGRFDRTFILWRGLLNEDHSQAHWIVSVHKKISKVAARAGIDYTPPPLKEMLSVPNEEDIAAAANATPQERQAMIEGMVTGLAQRLSEQGGSATEWARLITSLAVLGQTEKARSIYAEAQTAFAGDATALNLLQSTAMRVNLLNVETNTP